LVAKGELPEEVRLLSVWADFREIRIREGLRTDADFGEIRLQLANVAMG
jgi:hypothetical protein